jgi:hypothetical protein
MTRTTKPRMIQIQHNERINKKSCGEKTVCHNPRKKKVTDAPLWMLPYFMHPENLGQPRGILALSFDANREHSRWNSPQDLERFYDTVTRTRWKNTMRNHPTLYVDRRSVTIRFRQILQHLHGIDTSDNDQVSKRHPDTEHTTN